MLGNLHVRFGVGARVKFFGLHHTTVKNKKTTSTWFYVGVYCKNLKGVRGKHGRKPFTFAYYGVDVYRARWMFETYRKRFGIETSYRQMHECRIRTSTRKPSRYSGQTIFAIVVFCTGDADEELLDLVRASVRDGEWSPQTNPRRLHQLPRPAPQTLQFPR